MPAKSNSSQLCRHALAVKTEVASVVGDFCSYIGTVSQAVPAAYVAGSSVAHENQALCTQFSVTNFSFQIKDHTHTFHLIKKVTI